VAYIFCNDAITYTSERVKRFRRYRSIYPALSEEELKYVFATIKQFFEVREVLRHARYGSFCTIFEQKESQFQGGPNLIWREGYLLLPF
jgi:hypothetical protein